MHSPLIWFSSKLILSMQCILVSASGNTTNLFLDKFIFFRLGKTPTSAGSFSRRFPCRSNSTTRGMFYYSCPKVIFNRLAPEKKSICAYESEASHTYWNLLCVWFCQHLPTGQAWKKSKKFGGRLTCKQQPCSIKWNHCSGILTAGFI